MEQFAAIVADGFEDVFVKTAVLMVSLSRLQPSHCSHYENNVLMMFKTY